MPISMTTEEKIKSLKSVEPREVFLMVLNDVGQTYDIIGQITRTRLWVEIFIDGIIFQIDKDPKKFSKNLLLQNKNIYLN